MAEITEKDLDAISKECNLDFWQEELKKIDLTALKNVYKRDRRITPDLPGLVQYFLDNGQDFKNTIIEVSKLSNGSSCFYMAGFNLKGLVAEFLDKLVICLLINIFIKNLHKYYFYSKTSRIEDIKVSLSYSGNSAYVDIIFRDLDSGKEIKVGLSIWYQKPAEIFTINELINYLNTNSHISLTINDLKYGNEDSLKWLKIENLAHWLEVFGHIYK